MLVFDGFYSYFASLDADVKDIVDGVGNIASISATKVPHDSKPWYCSRSVNEKIRAFHDKCAAVPSDNDARMCYENYMNSLKKYLKSNNLCDREEYTGNIYFEMHFHICVFHVGLDKCQFLLFSSSIIFRNSFNDNLLFISFVLLKKNHQYCKQQKTTWIAEIFWIHLRVLF